MLKTNNKLKNSTLELKKLLEQNNIEVKIMSYKNYSDCNDPYDVINKLK